MQQLYSISNIVNGIEDDVKKLNGTITGKRVQKPNDDNWQDILKNLQINPLHIYEEPPICIYIVEKDDISRFASLGNFTAIIGKAKSRKTFFIAFLLSFVLRNDKENNNQKVKISLKNDKNVCLFFDTEQSNYDINILIKRIYKLAQVPVTETFLPYGLRILTPADRLFIIEKKLYETPNLGIVIIDGIRDLISDINSAEEATMITSKLLKWTEELNIHIIVVLHQNKADTNARGHLGTEIINKAESVLSIEKDIDLSIVKSEFCRGKDFAPFAFGISDAGLPYIIEDWIGKTKKEAKKCIEPHEVAKDVHWSVLKKFFP